jgi:hypothetical protein
MSIEANPISRSGLWRISAVMLLAALAVSCGSDAAGSSSAGAAAEQAASAPAPAVAASETVPGTTDAPAVVDRPTKPEYIRAAEAVCAQHTERTQLAVKQWKRDHDLNPDEVAPMELQVPIQQELVVPEVVAEFNELRALTRPLGDEAVLQRWFDAFDALLPAWREDPVNDDHWVEANAISEAYGINPEVC